MSMTKSMLGVAVVMALLVGGSLPVQAEDPKDIGKFAWRLAPGCEVVVLQVTQSRGTFALHGAGDLDGCGEPRRIPAEGAAFITGDGTTIVMGFTMLFPGNAIHVNARLNPTTVSGPWLDDLGNGGTLTFLGSRQ